MTDEADTDRLIAERGALCVYADGTIIRDGFRWAGPGDVEFEMTRDEWQWLIDVAGPLVLAEVNSCPQDAPTTGEAS